MPEIVKAAVIGAGVMGAGIAAQIANAGVPVVLLDVVPGGASAAIARMLKTEPQAFMVPSAASLVTPGDLGPDTGLLSTCDWIVEAIVENLAIKRQLYAAIAPVLKPGAIVSSNTSTIRLSELVDGMPETLRRNFLITHFFNPPRYMRLLEIVSGPRTDADAVGAVTDFADHRLGKSIVTCKDRPGFIANRLGCFWIQAAIVTAFDQGVTVEEADAAMASFGVPRTGIFGLADLIGIDLIPKVNASLAEALEPSDAFHSVNRPLPFVEAMIAKGLTGRKGKGGFYRINREQGKRMEALDLASGEYRAAKPVAADDASTLLAQESKLGHYARSVMANTLGYAVQLVGDAADDPASIDAAMRLGYNWTWGPFELIERIGHETFNALLQRQGLAAKFLPKPGPRLRSPGVVFLEDIKAGSKPLLANSSAALWDAGDGVACFELTRKMNTIDIAALELLERAVDDVARHHKALVISSDGPHFSAGIDLARLLFLINTADWRRIERLVELGQNAFRKLKYASFPSVAAISGYALGGGCELALHCSAIEAHAESAIGLPETSVGLIPDWGGIRELLIRTRTNGDLAKGPMPSISRTFELIALATISKSAPHARELMFLKGSDGITMNRDRLFANAKARALKLCENYRPPDRPVFQLPGTSARLSLDAAAEALQRQGKASAYDVMVAGALASVVSGGSADITRTVTEERMLILEREALMSLVRRPETRARIEHLLQTGKPLRN